MTDNRFSFSHLNVRSLCKGFDLFSDVVTAEDYDVMGLSETWLDTSVANTAVHIPNYKLVRKDRVGRGGGVAFYLKDSLKYYIITVPTGGSQLEQLWIGLKVGGKKLCLGTLYRPPHAGILQCFTDLENTITMLLPEFDIVLFGGDLNIDMMDSTSHGYSTFNDFFVKYNLKQLITDPTRVTDVSQTLLDVIVASSMSTAASGEVVRMDGISDHSLVNCKLRISKTRQTPFYKTYRDYSKFSYDSFREDMLKINWNTIYEFSNIDAMVEYLNANLLMLFDIHAPVKTVRISKPPAPWLTENLRLMMRLRNRAFANYKKNKTEQRWTEYKQLRNLVNMAVKSERKAYLQHIFRTDPKRFWRTLKWLNISTSSPVVSSVFSEVSAQDFNDFFIDSVPSTVTGSGHFISTTYENKLFPGLEERLSFSEVSITNIERIIYKIKSDARGVDGLDIKMLLFAIPHLSAHITYVINQCLLTGDFPSQWKMARVLPVPKNSSPSSLADFRPISILPVMSKILEHVASEQLKQFLDLKCLLPGTQSGFRANYSTTTALLKVTDDLYRACDDGMNTCLLMLDFSRAFDTLHHNTLLTKLKYFGMSEGALSFFHNYLFGRTQRVTLKNDISTDVVLNKGVPQGSVLGPLLFSIYTADFGSYLNFCKSHQYADDMQLYYSFCITTLHEAAENINSDLDVILKVSEAHNLSLNENKTKMLLFGKNRACILDDSSFRIVINKSTIVSVEQAKTLGVDLHVNLRFSSHVNSLIQKSFIKLKTLFMYKDLLSTEVKLRLSDALVLSCLTYCDIVYWPALLQKDRHSLQKIQNCCLRFSYNLRKFDHVSEKLGQSNWLTLNERFELHLAKLVFKLDSSGRPHYLRERLVSGSDVHVRETRYCHIFCVPPHRSALFERSFSYNAVKIFNSIPPSLKFTSSVATFGGRVRDLILARRNVT